MLSNYTAKYTKISSGYMGQLVEWPEITTKGRTLEKGREMLKDALYEMILAYLQQNKEILSLDKLFWNKYLSKHRMSVKRRDLIKYSQVCKQAGLKPEF